jgi:hypothetical protein
MIIHVKVWSSIKNHVSWSLENDNIYHGLGDGGKESLVLMFNQSNIYHSPKGSNKESLSLVFH